MSNNMILKASTVYVVIPFHTELLKPSGIEFAKICKLEYSYIVILSGFINGCK